VKVRGLVKSMVKGGEATGQTGGENECFVPNDILKIQVQVPNLSFFFQSSHSHSGQYMPSSHRVPHLPDEGRRIGAPCRTSVAGIA
jgi:hypothetical protein